MVATTPSFMLVLESCTLCLKLLNVNWTRVDMLIKMLLWVNAVLLEHRKCSPWKVLEFDFYTWARTLHVVNTPIISKGSFSGQGWGRKLRGQPTNWCIRMENGNETGVCMYVCRCLCVFCVVCHTMHISSQLRTVCSSKPCMCDW